MEVKDIENNLLKTNSFKTKVGKIISEVLHNLENNLIIDENYLNKIIDARLSEVEKIFKYIFIDEIKKSLKENKILNINGELIKIDFFLKFEALYKKFNSLKDNEKNEIMSQILESKI